VSTLLGIMWKQVEIHTPHSLGLKRLHFLDLWPRSGSVLLKVRLLESSKMSLPAVSARNGMHFGKPIRGVTSAHHSPRYSTELTTLLVRFLSPLRTGVTDMIPPVS
jgi:hypothetical protein